MLFRSPPDATVLHVDDAVTHMHLGSVLRLAGPVPEALGAHGERQWAED